MTDTTLKGCPIPGCGGEGIRAYPYPEPDSCQGVVCTKCEFGCHYDDWQAIPRPSAELGEIADAAPETQQPHMELGDVPPVDVMKETSWPTAETKEQPECLDCGLLRTALEQKKRLLESADARIAELEAQPGESVAEMWGECNNCGSRPFRWGLIRPDHKPGDQCPCCYLDDYDCDGVLVSLPVHGAQPKQEGGECQECRDTGRISHCGQSMHCGCVVGRVVKQLDEWTAREGKQRARADATAARHIETQREVERLKTKLDESADDCDNCEHAERYERVYKELDELRRKLVDVNHHAVLVSGTVPNTCPGRQLLVERIQSIGAVGSQPESTEQDDRGELPVCPDCGNRYGPSAASDGRMSCDCYDDGREGATWWMSQDDWLRHVAERTVCKECGELPEPARAMPKSNLVHHCPNGGLKQQMLWSLAEWIDRNEVKDEDPEKMRERVRPTTGPAEQGDLPRVPGQDHKEVETVGEAGARGQQVGSALKRAREAACSGRRTCTGRDFEGAVIHFMEAILEHLEGVDDRLYDLTKSNSQAWSVIGSMGERLDAADKRRCRYDPSASCGADESEGE